MNNKAIRLVLSISLNAIIIFLGVWVVFKAGSLTYSFGHNIFNEEAVSTEENAREVQITITDESTNKTVARNIYNMGLAKDERIIYFQIILSDYKGKFKNGVHTVNTAMKPSEILHVLCSSEEEN